MNLLPATLLEQQGQGLATWTLTTAAHGTDQACDECNDHATLYYTRPVLGQQDVAVCIDCIFTAIQNTTLFYVALGAVTLEVTA